MFIDTLESRLLEAPSVVLIFVVDNDQLKSRQQIQNNHTSRVQKHEMNTGNDTPLRIIIL